MKRLPPLRALQAFEAVGRLGGLAEAARELNVSPGAVSQQLRRLEETLSAALLERSGRGVALTRLGAAYHREVAAAFAQLQAAERALEKARGEGALVLSSLTSVVNKWIGRRIFDWTEKNPDAQLRLEGAEEAPALDRDGVDFRIFYGDGESHARYAPLFTDSVTPACAPRQLAALLDGRAAAAPKDVFGRPLLHVAWRDRFDDAPLPSWTDWARAFGGVAPPADGALNFALTSSAIDAAVDGRGFVLGQISMMQEELDDGRLVAPFAERLKLRAPYQLAWSRAALDKPKGPALRAWLLALGKTQQRLSAVGAER